MKVNKNLTDMYKTDTIGPSKVQQEFIKWFDSYQVNPLLSYFSLQDIQYLHKLAMSAKLNCNVKEKYRLIGELMKKRGFELAGGGTNRRAYYCIYDKRVVAKVATDQVGFTSNLRELVNQNVLKPFCCKIFEVSPCGTLALIENVVPIKSVTEFQKYAQDIYDILYFKIRNNSIGMEDIGTRSMKNWGYRNGFGPVLLDYPTMYVMDPSRRLCRNIVNGQMCGGTLDYDEGFNVIVCSECGRTHFAKTLAKPQGEEIDNLLQAVGYQQKQIRKESIAMKFEIVDLTTGETVDVRETGSKSGFVNTSRGRKKTKAFVDLNEHPYPKPKKPVKINFTVECLGFNIDDDEPVVEEEPVVEKEEPVAKETPKQDDVIVTSVTDSNKPDIFDIYMEQVARQSSAMVEAPVDILKSVREDMTGTIFNRSVTDSLLRNVAVATMIDTTTVRDFDILTSDNTLVADMLDRINPDTSIDRFVKFNSLLNSVKNSKTFFEQIVNLFNSMLNMTNLNVDENVGNEDQHTIYRDVFNKYHMTVMHMIEDFIINVTYSNKSYNTSNSTSYVTTTLSELEDIVNLGYADATKAVIIYRGQDCATQEFIDLEDDDDDYYPESDSNDVEPEETQGQNVLEDSTPKEEDSEDAVQNQEEDNTISEPDSSDDDSDDTDIDISDDSDDDDTDPAESISTKIMVSPTFLYGGANTNKPISRKQQWKYSAPQKKQKKGKKRRK